MLNGIEPTVFFPSTGDRNNAQQTFNERKNSSAPEISAIRQNKKILAENAKWKKILVLDLQGYTVSVEYTIAIIIKKKKKTLLYLKSNFFLEYLYTHRGILLRMMGSFLLFSY